MEICRDASQPVEGIKQLFLSERFADVWLVVGDKKYPAHRFVLAQSSDFFRQLFSTRLPCVEQATKQVAIHTRPASAFLDALRFMYLRTVTLHKENIAELWECACFYGIPSLADDIKKSVMEVLESAQDVVQVYSKTARLDDLGNQLQQAIASNFAKHSSALIQVSPDLLLPVLDHPDLKLESESQLFTFLSEYVHAPREPPLARDDIASLFSHVLFECLPAPDLGLAISDSLVPKPPVTDALLKRLEYHETPVLRFTPIPDSSASSLPPVCMLSTRSKRDRELSACVESVEGKRSRKRARVSAIMKKTFVYSVSLTHTPAHCLSFISAHLHLPMCSPLTAFSLLCPLYLSLCLSDRLPVLRINQFLLFS